MNFDILVSGSPAIVKRKLEQLKFLRERPDYHPEPSVFHHIRIVTERLIPTGDMNLVMAGILHDICKLDTVRMNEKTGWPTSPGHDDEAHALIRSMDNGIFGWIQANGGDAFKVAGICKNHMRFHQIGQMRETKRKQYIEGWKNSGIWDYLQIFGAADNMLVEFDLDNLEQSWKFNRQ